MTTDTQFLSTREVAEILGVHQKTVHHWLRTGRLAGTKISYRAWRISRAALDEFIAKNSNMQPKNEIAGIHPTVTQPGSEHTGENAPEAKMKHYIREIMGENNTHSDNK
jgi:excisionase family DNA binding protein